MNYIQTLKAKFVEHKVKGSLIIIVLLVIGYYGYKSITNTGGQTSYVVGNVTRDTVVVTISGTGQVSSSNQLDITAKASGDIVRTYVQAGQSVSSGDMIAQIDSTSAKLALDSAQVAYDKLVSVADPLTVDNAQNTLSQSYNNGWNAVSGIFIAYPDMMTKMNNLFYSTSGYLFDSAKQPDSARPYIQKAGASYDAVKLEYNVVLSEYNSLTRTSATSSIDSLIEDTHQMVQKTIDAMKDTQNAISYITNLNSDTSVSATTAATNVNGWLTSLNSQLSTLLSAQGSILSNTSTLYNLVQGANVYDVRSQSISLQQQKNNYANYFIRAPFDGVIGKTDVKVGNSISSGGVIATIITKSQMSNISLNEVDAAKVKIGDKVTLTFDAVPNLIMTGKVSEIDLIGAVTQGVVTYNTQITFDSEDPRILPGMSVSASIITDTSSDTLVVPGSAVKTDTRGSYIQIFSPPLTGTSTSAGILSTIAPTKVYIQTGLSNDTLTEILSGANLGDQIVLRTVAVTTATPISTTPSLLGGAGTRGLGGATRGVTGGGGGGGGGGARPTTGG